MNFKEIAVILVGYQNDYFAENGILRGVVEELGRVDEVLKNSISLIKKLIPKYLDNIYDDQYISEFRDKVYNFIVKNPISYKINNSEVTITYCTNSITDVCSNTGKLVAIVNAANQICTGGGGIDGAIHKAAGTRLLEACLKIDQDPPNSSIRCKAGTGTITAGYNLPAHYVIHTTGPICSSNEIDADIDDYADPNYLNIINPYTNEKNLPNKELNKDNIKIIKDCFKNCLLLANKYAIEEIAFPSISERNA